MNLIDLFSRKDRTAEFGPSTQVVWRTLGKDRWRALSLHSGERIVLRSFLHCHPIWTRPETLGWFAAGDEGAQLTLSFLREDTVISSSTIPLTAAPAPVPLPWPSTESLLDDKVELVLHLDAGKEAALLVHRALSRQPLYDLAKGTGVEIGPGPVPQIKPSSDTSVMYVEETSPEQWAALYDQRGNYGASSADWSNIMIGKAGALPVEDGSQDFIFSSHVFEHLANPLGHLHHWYDKLASGGYVLAIVPDIASTKDRAMRPSPHAEILDEFERAIFEPEFSHFERYTRRLRGGRVDTALAKELMARSESIHVHFYDRYNIAEVLQTAQDRIGYAAFQLVHSKNHKDFHFVLKK